MYWGGTWVRPDWARDWILMGSPATSIVDRNRQPVAVAVAMATMLEEVDEAKEWLYCYLLVC